MKVALITDLHFACKKGNDIFLESQMRFFLNQFIPYLKKNKITTIIILGDFFDNRVYLDSKVLSRVLDLFENHLKEYQIHIIVGNHDSYFDSTIEVNSIKTLGTFPNVHVYSEVTEIELDGTKILLCPWITKKEDFISDLAKYTSDICMGHFEIAKCPMFKNQLCEHGMETSTFLSKFKLTLSGHFHTRSTIKFDGNKLIYIGNAFQMTRNDIDDERGFTILDLKTLGMKFIENTESMKFVSLHYPEEISKEKVYNNHIDLNVVYDDNYNEHEVQKYIERLEDMCPAYPVVVKTINNISIESGETFEVTSISDLIKEYLEKSDIPNIERKNMIISTTMDLYNECVLEM